MPTGHDTPRNYGSPWLRDELILAFDLYCRIPFKKTKASNPEVISLAKLLDRSPAAVARKLGNFGSFDPELQKQQVTGLLHASKLDAEVWDEFNSDWNRLILEARRLREQFIASHLRDAEATDFVGMPSGPSEREGARKIRIYQAFFRQAVLSSYDETCCITGLTIKDVLVASHIIPWSVAEAFRADPRNGLCLSATFDRLFDRGLLTISSDFRVVVAESVRSIRARPVANLVSSYHDCPVRRPHRFFPDEERLQWHRDHIFRD